MYACGIDVYIAVFMQDTVVVMKCTFFIIDLIARNLIYVCLYVNISVGYS